MSQFNSFAIPPFSSGIKNIFKNILILIDQISFILLYFRAKKVKFTHIRKTPIYIIPHNTINIEFKHLDEIILALHPYDIITFQNIKIYHVDQNTFALVFVVLEKKNKKRQQRLLPWGLHPDANL